MKQYSLDARTRFEEDGWVVESYGHEKYRFGQTQQWVLSYADSLRSLTMLTETSRIRDDWKLYLASSCCRIKLRGPHGFCRACKADLSQYDSIGRLCMFDGKGYFPGYEDRVGRWAERAGFNVLEAGIIAQDSLAWVYRLAEISRTAC